MKKTSARAAKPVQMEEAKKQEEANPSQALTAERLEQRAFAKTEVLINILEREQRPQWRHWGLNE